MGLWQKISDFMTGNDEYLEEEYEFEPSTSYEIDEIRDEPNSQTRRQTNNVVPFQLANDRKSSKIFVVEPSVYSEAERIGDALLNGEAVVINFSRMEASEAKRVIDFVAGVAYAIRGDVQKVKDGIFICSPANIKVQGSLDEETMEFTYRGHV